MSDDSRRRILARIRGIGGGRDAASIERELAALGAAPGAPAPDEDPVTSFMCNVLRNHGSVDIAADRRAAVEAVGRYLYRELRSHRLVAGNDPHLAAMPWRDGGVLPRFGTLENGEQAALSYAPWGIAETGATVLVTGRYSPSSNHLLPVHHLVLVESANILPDLEAFWQRSELPRGKRPRGISFVAGPSSTGDIEAKLVYGAHGPQAWHVIVMGEVAPDALQRANELAGRAAQSIPQDA
ncbi:hypothetical protein E4634_10405 [Mangrovimicrobium sediminis]|uniref:LUD domain-containing protein n=1 Tax=Mangrovimicrobium sediminis TaxID=2562682 RepID=A0A4Z0M1X6_9GAMM|nr:LUD domain-containing protein [Haliea sp. SAOS-164]TGD73437.1 hypothetical protein E4634_10405 [Haliea sp. SAOS-164]